MSQGSSCSSADAYLGTCRFMHQFSRNDQDKRWGKRLLKLLLRSHKDKGCQPIALRTMFLSRKIGTVIYAVSQSNMQSLYVTFENCMKNITCHFLQFICLRNKPKQPNGSCSMVAGWIFGTLPAIGMTPHHGRCTAQPPSLVTEAFVSWHSKLDNTAVGCSRNPPASPLLR